MEVCLAPINSCRSIFLRIACLIFLSFANNASAPQPIRLSIVYFLSYKCLLNLIYVEKTLLNADHVSNKYDKVTFISQSFYPSS